MAEAGFVFIFFAIKLAYLLVDFHVLRTVSLTTRRLRMYRYARKYRDLVSWRRPTAPAHRAWHPSINSCNVEKARPTSYDFLSTLDCFEFV